MQRFKIPVCLLLIVGSFVAGASIPAFYDWTGANQGQIAPLVGQTAIGLLACGVFVCSILPFLPIEDYPLSIESSGKVQFKMRTILALTTVAAICLALVLFTPFSKVFLHAIAGFCYLIALGYCVRMAVVVANLRWQIASLLACMYFPFVWLVNYPELSNINSLKLLGLATGLPALLPTLLIGSLRGQHMEDSVWLLNLLAGLQIFLGTWLLQLGLRRSLACMVVLLISSIFGSFALNALLRA